jgi:hypothetical protein
LLIKIQHFSYNTLSLFYMTTTNTSIFSTNTTSAHPSDSKRIYEFEIDLFGTGFDAFISQIWKLPVSEQMQLDLEGIRETADFPQGCGESQELPQLIPTWAKQCYAFEYRGIDVSRDYEIVVRSENGGLLFQSNEDGEVKPDPSISVPGRVTADELFGGSPYLYARDFYPIHIKYRVKANMPFDPSLVIMQCGDVFDALLVARFEYDGQLVDPEFIIRPCEHDRSVHFVAN